MEILPQFYLRYGIFCAVAVVSNSLFSTSLAAREEIIPITIRHGIESQMSLNWPLDNIKAVFLNEYFDLQQNYAKKAGGDLTDFIDELGFATFDKRNNSFYFLFYNLIKEQNCHRQFLIQRVRLDHSFYNDRGKLIKESKKYLVEVFRTGRNRWRRADGHFKSYSLNNSSKRKTDVHIEVGCGTISNVLDGRVWPFNNKSLFEVVQDYSSEPGLYNEIDLDSSTSYSFSFEFSADGNYHVKWPEFMYKR